MAKARRNARIGVGEMARRLSVGEATISRWENGRVRPPKLALFGYASETGCDLDFLLTGAGAS